MRNIIQDQVTHTFFEGPIQTKQSNNSSQAESIEKVAYPADPTQGYEVDGKANKIDIPDFDVNERYD